MKLSEETCQKWFFLSTFVAMTLLIASWLLPFTELLIMFGLIKSGLGVMTILSAVLALIGAAAEYVTAGDCADDDSLTYDSSEFSWRTEIASWWLYLLCANPLAFAVRRWIINPIRAIPAPVPE